MAAPLVPGTGIVARVVARGAQRERGERRARAGVAVRDDLRSFRQAHDLADALGRGRLARAVEELRRARRDARRGCGPAADRTELPLRPVYSSGVRMSRRTSDSSPSRDAISCRVGIAREVRLEARPRAPARARRRPPRARPPTRPCRRGEPRRSDARRARPSGAPASRRFRRRGRRGRAARGP